MEPQFSFKRHHQHAPPQMAATTADETVFRILCPAGKAGGVIGKGGAVIRQLREETGARIRVVDEVGPPQCDERVIVISGPEDGGAVRQGALVRVFERILKVDEERGGDEGGGGGSVVCRLLAGSNQIGSVLGRGGKVVEKIRNESGARVRVLPRESLPPCASPGDELIQITGSFPAVKRALLSVSSCLQEHTRGDLFQGANVTASVDSFHQKVGHASGHHSRGFSGSSASEIGGPNLGLVSEEEVVFRLLCQADKIGSLIGKGGCVIRGIENESGTSIKVSDAGAHDSDERVVVILARESFDMKHSSAQDAVIRVHNRISEIGFEPGAAVVARLLVSSQQIGCLLGKGGHIIADMRRLTGASIRIFGREQSLKFGTQNDEIVQVTGNMQSVQDALFQITGRLREITFPPRSHPSHVSCSPYLTFPELPSPSFRPRHDHGYDNPSAGQGQAPSPAVSLGMDRTSGANNEQERRHYAGERGFYGPPFERPPSPKGWYPQVVNNGNDNAFSNSAPGPSGMVVTNSETGQMPIMKSVEVVVPQILLPHIYGENRSNIGHITQLSGADVVVHDPKPGATEGLVVISGTPNEVHTAQTLVQAFILCGQAF